MNNTPSRPGLSRRNFLRLTAAAGVTAVATYALSETTPWLDPAQQAARTRQPLGNGSPLSADTRELVRYATLAANGHNTQPWRFAVKADSVEIHPDYTRRLPVVDPADRELWTSLGCALENLLLAAGAAGYAAEVTYPDVQDFVRVRLTADTPQSSPLFDAIPLRQNTRSAYDGQPVKPADLGQVMALPLEPGIALRAVTDSAGMARILEYVQEGNLTQYADRAFLNELIGWLRFNKKEALASRDGLYSRCSGNPEVPRWLGQMFVTGGKPQQQADADAAKLRSSPGAAVIASEADTRTAWVRAGQVYERLALKMTTLGIKSAFLNQPIEVAALRSQFQGAMGLGPALPQLLVRFGHAAAMPPSLRRPVEQVLIQS
jgi:hypothetical protein